MGLLKLAKKFNLFRLLQFNRENKVFLIILSIWILWVVLWAWVLPYNMAPDECLHFKTAQFFQTHRGFPIANKDVTFVHEPDCVGTTYITTPFLNYAIASLFVNLGNNFGIERDYLATRMSSVFFGLVFVIFYYLFLKKIFGKNRFLVFSALVSTIFIPQVTYIFSYLNHEAYSLASSSFLFFVTINFYKLSSDQLKQNKQFILLGLAITLHLFAKTNFLLLLLVPGIVISYKIWQERKIYFKKLLILISLISILSGWFFIRNYILYNDFLGVKIYQLITRSNFGTRTYAQAGWNFYDILFKSQWLEETVSSFYGRFGYMTIEIDPVMQWIFRFFVFMGIVGLIKKIISIKKFYLNNKNAMFYLLFSSLIPINFAISLYNTLYFDFQNQGRYLFPILMPLMILVNRGIFELAENKNSQKTLTIAVITGSIFLSFWSFLYLPKI